MPAPPDLGRYVARRRIGSGGFATVWLAHDEQLDADVAVKVLAENWTEDHQVRTRFVEEGRYLRRVESSHVVTVYDAGELDDGRPYLVMTYADQGTLADRLEAGRVRPGEALEVVTQLGSGLQALHDHDIMHRDVKPANVLFRTVDGRTRAMLGDLGLGKALDVSSRLTMIAGTPSYVAPEQAQGEAPDARADQYSLGVLTYLLLSGRQPWSHADLTAAARPGPPPPLSTRERPVPPEAEAVVRRALALEPDERWPSVTAYVDALGQALGGWTPTGAAASAPVLDLGPRRSSGTDASAALAPTRRRRRAGVALAGALTLAVGLAGGWFAVQALRPGETTLSDARGELGVTVPRGWASVVGDPWTPPGQARDYPALSAGTSARWQESGAGEGVFVAILPGRRLPTVLPEHPTCDDGSPAAGEEGGERSRTAYYTGCPGVVVERVVKVAPDRTLWVQVRSSELAVADEVLASVTESL